MAEDLITDKHALNKSKTKIIKGLEKWRVKTIDFANDLFNSAAQALGAAEITTETKPASNPVNNSGPTVIAQKQPVIPVTPTVESDNKNGILKEVSPTSVPKDAIKMSEGKLVIVIGSDTFNMTMMTANAGGSIGVVDGKPVVFTILTPDQPYEALQRAQTYIVKFFPNGKNEPSLILDCNKLPEPPVYEGQPRTFIGEITKAWIQE